MAQYINKEALVAWIKSLKSAAETMLTGKTDLSYWEAQRCLCERFLSFLDTLEVKEVDLEKEIKSKIAKYYDACEKHLSEMKDDDGDISFLTLDSFAKYFFELGIKAKDK